MADRTQNRPTLQPSNWDAASEYASGEIMPAEQQGASTDVSVQGSIITAQRVAKPRSLQKVMHDIQVLAKMNGHRYVYAWEQNDRKNNRKVTISGPTIKLANDLVRVYGNCVVDVHVEPGKEYTIFYARFVDLETGFSLTRAFRQRQNQKLGMGDAEREEDIKFQIGQSKAIRNVVVNALSTLVDYAVEEADNNLLAWVENNVEKAKKFVERVATQHQIEQQRIEAVIGRPQEKWTNRDYARALTELRGVDEGLVSADDAFPSQEDAKAVTATKDREREEGKRQQPASGGGQQKSQAKSGGQQKKSQGTKKQQEAKDDGAKAEAATQAAADQAPAGAEPEAPVGDDGDLNTSPEPEGGTAAGDSGGDDNADAAEPTGDTADGSDPGDQDEAATSGKGADDEPDDPFGDQLDFE